MKTHSNIVMAASVALCLSLSAAAVSAQSGMAELTPVTVPTPVGPQLNSRPTTVVTGSIEGLGGQAATAASIAPPANAQTTTAAEATKAKAPTVKANVTPLPQASAKKAKGAKVKAKGVVQTLIATKPSTGAPVQANAGVDAKVQTH